MCTLCLGPSLNYIHLDLFNFTISNHANYNKLFIFGFYTWKLESHAYALYGMVLYIFWHVIRILESFQLKKLT